MRPEAALSNRRLRWIGAFTIFSATVFCYWPALRGDFIWDDDRHVSENPTLRDMKGLSRIWFRWGATPQYYPLTHTSFWIEYRFFELNPTGYHVTNVVLHAVNALLLWRLLWVLEISGAWLAAAIFALHPINVESVAWISERKNVLAMGLALGSILMYLKQTRRAYAASLVLFGAAMLSKTFVATVPAVILLLIWWKRGRVVKRDMMLLSPMFMVAVAMGIMTAIMERRHVGALGADWELSPAQRVLIAGRAVWFYVRTLVYPVELTFSYPRWVIDVGSVRQWILPIAAAVLLLALGILSRRWGRGPAAAGMIFVGTLFPALGFFNVYPMRYSFVADHFAYMSGPALIAVVVAGAGKVLRAGLAPVGAAVLVALAALTWKQAQVYAGAETVWRDTIAKNPSSWMARHNLAVCLSVWAEQDRAAGHEAPARRKLEEALNLLAQVELLRPQHDKLHRTRADVLAKLGRFDEALTILRREIDKQPTDLSLQVRLAQMLEDSGRVEQAMQQLIELVEQHPHQWAISLELGLMLSRHHRAAEARPVLEQYLEQQPDDIAARVALGYVYGELGDFDRAAEQFRTALERDPDCAPAQKGMELLRRAGRR
jgi:tetratricopeptide (TPR) repeat protein